MRKLSNYMKPYFRYVLVIAGLLIIQAFCTLSLPAYTSDIVNVGIQQGGIDDEIPDSISESELERLEIFMRDNEREFIHNIYRRNPNEKTYILDKKQTSDSDMSKAVSILKTPMIMTESVESGKISLHGKTEEDVFSYLEGLSSDEKDRVIEELQKNIDKMSETMIHQTSVNYIRRVYESQGIDVDKAQIHYLMVTGGKMLVVAFFAMVASVMVGMFAARVAAAIGRDLRLQVFQKVVGFSNAEFDRFSTASLITRSTNDIQQIQSLIVMLLRMVMYAPIMAVGAIIKVFYTNVRMSWIIVLAVALIFGIVLFMFKITMPRFKILQKLVDRLNLVTREILTGLPVIRAFSTEKVEKERFDKANIDLTKTNLFVNRVMTMMMPLMMLIMNAISVLIVWVGATGINNGNMQVGDMMAFIQYTIEIILAFLVICMISIMLPRAAVAADRVDEVLNSETVIRDPETPKAVGEDHAKELVFDHVGFRYPGAEEEVLHDITFTARPGETTAIIGSTGCGKSTLVNLIPRFYDVTSGAVRIGGEDIRDIRQEDLRNMLGYVPQKGVLFSGTIRSNICYSDDATSDKDMKEAASIAQATEFIDEKPHGYDSVIAQGGTNVSGGQKQRLSIARAIASNPEIFIFDDSFSALDYKTDVVLRNELRKKTKDKIVLIVAQRISTILNAEQIIVLDEGKIVGIGTHKELLKSCETYYQIASSQLSETELNSGSDAQREGGE